MDIAATVRVKPIESPKEKIDSAIRLERILDLIERHNDAQSSNKKRVFAGQSILYRVTGETLEYPSISYFQEVIPFCGKHKSRIDAINTKHNLTIADNSKGKALSPIALLLAFDTDGLIARRGQ